MKSFFKQTGEVASASTWLKGVADDATTRLRQQKAAADALLATAKTNISSNILAAGETRGPDSAHQEAFQPQGPGIKDPPKKDQQFLRLPIESAKKLRFYDQADLSALVSAHTKEKEVLYNTCSALQRLCEKTGVSAEWIDREVEQLLHDKNCLRAYDDAINATLLVAAQEGLHSMQDEMINLRSEVAALRSHSRRVSKEPAALLATDPSHGSSGPGVQLGLLVVQEEEGKERVCVQMSTGQPQAPLGGKQPGGGDTARLEALQDEVTSLEQQLCTEKAKSDGLIAKLQRLEEEKKRFVENSSAEVPECSGGDEKQLADLQRKLAVAEDEAAKGVEQVKKYQAKLKVQEEEAERKLAELRQKVSQAGQQQSEMLRRAQDICMEAEERADTAERKTSKAEGRVTQLESEARELKGRIRELEKEAKRLEKEREKADLRAEAAENAISEVSMKGHVEAQAGATMRSHIANLRRAAEEKETELRRTMTEKEAAAEEEIGKHKDRCHELEDEVASLTSQLSRAQAESEAWEGRIKEADEREASLLSDLREAEAMASERDLMAVRMNALEDKLNESRTERGQLENYKQVARELEAARARAEDELMATARIVTGLEGRLRNANREADQCRLSMETAEKRSMELERHIEAEVKSRMATAGADRGKWPREAQLEVTRLEQKAHAVKQMLATIEEQLDSETKARQSDSRHAVVLRQRVSELEAASIRNEREAGDRVRLLEKDLRAAREEAEECRKIVSEVEEERMALQDQLKPRVQDENGLFRNRGGGSLYGASDEEMAANKQNIQRDELTGVDIVYLKNVVLKFIEASVRNDTLQRNALVPAIATLVQATPQEFKALVTLSHEVEEETASSWPSFFGGART